MERSRDGLAYFGDQLVALRRLAEIFGERDVIARFRFAEQLRDVWIVAPHLRTGVRHLAGRLEFLEEFLRVVFRLLHVRLIEGIDAEERAGDGGCKFPREENFAEVEG